jgi:hypothetical protein
MAETSRIELYNDFRSDAEKNEVLSEFDNKYADFSSWESVNFKNNAGVKSIWNKSLKNILDPVSLKDFYKKFACDLSWAKKTTYCGGSGGGGNTTDLPDWAKCLESSGAKKQTENTVLIKNKKGNKLYFSISGKFQYTFASSPGTPNEMGKWSCNGNNGYLITMDDGDTWDGTKWIDKVESTGKEKEKKKKNVAELTKGWVKDPTGNTTWEYQVRECKWIAKKRGIPTEYVLGDNPKYAGSVKKLNDFYPTLVANCKKDSKTDSKTDNKFKFDAGNFKPGILELPKTNYSSEMSKVAAADRNQEAEDPNIL